MPEDARAYLLGTTQEVADFFGVRPGDILGIMRQEQNNAGWRLSEPRVSSAGATGVGQVVSRTWNGWSNPEHSNYVRNVADIEMDAVIVGALAIDILEAERRAGAIDHHGARLVLDQAQRGADGAAAGIVLAHRVSVQ